MRHGMLWTLAALLVAGCAGTPDPATGGTPDAGTGSSGLACDYPTSGYGSNVGKNLEPFALTNCDGSGDYQFVNADFCKASFTVLSIAAGWCHPCQEESKMLTDKITNAYKDRGVRVVQVLVQNPDYSAPTASFCNQWVHDYNLVNTELIDPNGLIEPYFPSNSLPSTVIVDAHGKIRAREDGVSPNLETLRAKLDALLAE